MQMLAVQASSMKYFFRTFIVRGVDLTLNLIKALFQCPVDVLTLSHLHISAPKSAEMFLHTKIEQTLIC